jgi:hypothetical protein
MLEAHLESLPDRRGRQRARADLLRVTNEGKRLASVRRGLGGLLIIVGTPVVVLSHSTDPTIRRALMLLAFVWLFLLLPVIRLVCMEWHTLRLTENLRALIDSDVDGR